MKINCLIVDDEPMARKGMEEYVREIDYLNLVASCESASKASSFITEGKVDLLLLDIQMPKLSGIDFLKTLSNPPMAIFTTAYSEYALEGYSLDVLDYLVKPVAFDRFLKAIQKAHDFYRLKHSDIKTEHEGNVANEADYFFVKCNGKYEKIFFNEVLFAESLQNYVIIHTKTKKLITYLTLSGLEKQLPSDQFVKVHKSHIVSIPSIQLIDGNEIVIQTHRIPVSRYLKEEVMKKIMGSKLVKR